MIHDTRAFPASEDGTRRLGARWVESRERDSLFDFGWYHENVDSMYRLAIFSDELGRVLGIGSKSRFAELRRVEQPSGHLIHCWYCSIRAQWEATGEPQEGWVWPSETASGHIDRSTVKKQHDTVSKTIEEQAKKDKLAPVRRFVIYELRHTFLTRLGMSGCDAWTHARIAGHGDIRVSMRYVHSPEDAVLAAMSRAGGWAQIWAQSKCRYCQPQRQP